MKPSELIDKALTEVIPTEATWERDRAHSLDGEKHCIVGAVGKAVNEDLDILRSHIYDQALNEIRHQIRTYTDGKESAIGAFNQYHGYQGARIVMEKARAALQEEGR